MYWRLPHISKNVNFIHSLLPPPPPLIVLLSSCPLKNVYNICLQIQIYNIQIYHIITTHKLLVYFSVTCLTVLATLTPYLYK